MSRIAGYQTWPCGPGCVNTVRTPCSTTPSSCCCSLPNSPSPHSQVAADAIREASRYHPVLAVLPALRVLAYMSAGDLPNASASLAEPAGPLDHPILENLTRPALRAWTALQE